MFLLAWNPMQSKSTTQRFDDLFTAKVVDVQERAQFETRAGWRYGLVFGVVLVLIGWGIDAAELAYTHAALVLPKLLLAFFLLIPLSMAAGALAGRAHGSVGRKLLLWVACGAIIGFLAIHIPFDGVSLLVALVDPAARGIATVPFVPGVQERVPVLVIFGALAGLFIGVLQVLGTTWAWDRSSKDNRITVGGWLALMVSMPLAIVLGAVFDGAASAQLRGPLYTTHRVIQLALSTPPDMNLQGMDTPKMLDYLVTARWRSQFTPEYEQHLADFDPATLKSSYVDTEFSNGFLWRCNVTRNGEILQGCMDLNETYRDWMTQFLTKGKVQCENCNAEVSKAAAEWQARQGAIPAPTQVTVTHRAGGIILANAQLANGGQVECRVVGADPPVIHDCASK